ncbi:MAG TPA: DEAD/DEAH box helicase, partial [Kofleriaceae bacterium]|nr:DEAD/DEAH box helicase [Kofleriaceae bacterium]
MSRSVPVLVPLPLDTPFDYAADGFELRPGDYVEVPFGPRRIVGVVWDCPSDRPVATERLKPVARRLDAPPMPRPLRRLVDHLAQVTLHPLGNALKLALSVPAALEPPAPKLGLVAAPACAEAKLTAPRRRVLEALAERSPQTPAQLARAAGVSTGVVQAMAKAGLLASVPLPEADDPPERVEGASAQLSPDQQAVADHLIAMLGRGHRVGLLEGLPGAGKTEVYLEAVAAALERGDQALVLLPEIALTTQVLERFARRFGRPPAVWHSEIGSAARRRLWRRIAEGREPIVIGARSALFLPLPALGLIVVDEEHDGSFKQEDGVAYQGRDMAIARGRFEDCPVILVSATPA